MLYSSLGDRVYGCWAYTSWVVENVEAAQTNMGCPVKYSLWAKEWHHQAADTKRWDCLGFSKTKLSSFEQRIMRPDAWGVE